MQNRFGVAVYSVTRPNLGARNSRLSKARNSIDSPTAPISPNGNSGTVGGGGELEVAKDVVTYCEP